MSSIVSLICFLIYPVWLPYHILKTPVASASKKIMTVLFSILVLIPIWVGGYFTLVVSGVYGMQFLGYITTDIPVTGASMLPTFDEEGFVAVRHYPRFSAEVKKIIPEEKLEPQIKRGDVIVFKNSQTNKVFAEQNNDPKARGGFVKRVIGISGDTVRIENGYVYVNGRPITESYILKPRSTFGAEAVRDCQEVRVPPGKFMVLGDNRKISVDSRQIGLVDTRDIFYYLPFTDQVSQYGTRWRDTAADNTIELTSELDVERYVTLLNAKRARAGRESLKYNSKLSQSAKLRAEVMLKYDDTSFEATRSGFTMDDAMAKVGYSNIVYGEFPIVGYYDAQELIDAIFEYPNSRDYMLERDYQEIGISTFVGERNNCPVQIVVQHLAGYKPPNYAVKDIEEWKTLVDKLEEIKGGWKNLQNNEESKEFYENNKADVDRVNEIITTRQDRARAVIRRMEANEWFTAEEERFINDDKVLFEEQNQISERINNKIQGEG